MKKQKTRGTNEPKLNLIKPKSLNKQNKNCQRSRKFRMFKKMKKVEKDERKQKKINSPLYRKWHCVMMIKLTVAF